jgi:hypothetical protein
MPALGASIHVFAEVGAAVIQTQVRPSPPAHAACAFLSSGVRAILEDEEEAALLPFVGSMSMDDGPDAVLRSMKDTLNLDLALYRSGGQGNPTPNGFDYLR